MPELAEVEVVKDTLKKVLINRSIKELYVFYDKIFPDFKSFDYLNACFLDISRKGKYLIFHLSNGYLVSHLKMEGKYYYVKDFSQNTHMHVIFKLDNGYSLIYQDVRKFGCIEYYKDIKEVKKRINIAFDANLGLDYLDEFRENIRKKRGMVKCALLDQKVIAGLGNIYVDEVLYGSSLMPTTKTSNLTDLDLKNILINSKKILDDAILHKGTTIKSYTSSLGVFGTYQDKLKVHTKAICPLGHKVLKIQLNSRGTYFCPICQGNKDYIVGLTGGIASGKSTVTNYLREIGYQVFCADAYVRSLYFNEDFILKVKSLFNLKINDVLEIKKHIKDKIFKSKDDKIKLESLIHPLVKLAILEFIKDKKGLVFLDVPLLFEAKLDSLCDIIVSIKVNPKIQLERLCQRDNLSVEEANRIISSQIPEETRLKNSDYVLSNDNNIDDLKTNVAFMLADILKE